MHLIRVAKRGSREVSHIPHWLPLLTDHKCMETVVRQNIRVFASLDLGHGMVPVLPDL